MNESDGEAIATKLDTLIRLVAMALCEGKPQKDQIALLHSAGLQPKAIAGMLDTTPNTVSVALSSLRKGMAVRRKPGSKGTKK